MLSKNKLVSVALFVSVSALVTLTLVAADAECEQCKMYVTLGLERFKQNAKDQLLSLIELKVCPQLGEHADYCVVLVRTRGAKLVAHFCKADPVIMCGLIGKCENTIKFKLRISDYIKESVCVENLINAKQTVSDKSLQQLAKDRLRALCRKFGVHAPQCSHSLEIYWPVLTSQLSVIVSLSNLI